MKVDFPHPESAATPMMTGVWPSASASREVAVLKVEGVETGAKADATENKAEIQRSFMVVLLKERDRNVNTV
jgi:hypothetical protein